MGVSPCWSGEHSTCTQRVLTKIFAPTLQDQGRVLTGKDIRTALLDQVKNGFKPKEVAGNLGKFLFYPTVAPLNLFGTAAEVAVKRGKKELWRVPFEYIKKDGLIAAGYITTYQVIGGTPVSAALFYLLPKNENIDYMKETETPDRTDGLRVYVDAIPNDNILHGFGEGDFEERFRKKSGYYLHPANTRDMMEQLAALSEKTGKPIAQMEVLGHGAPGMIELGKDHLGVSTLSLLDHKKVPFVKDAEIRFQSCFLGANLRCNIGKPGEDFVRGFGEKLMKNGGMVTASNRIIYVMNFSDEQMKSPERWYETAAHLWLEPLEAAMITGTNLMIDTREPYRKVKIPASTSSDL